MDMQASLLLVAPVGSVGLALTPTLQAAGFGVTVSTTMHDATAALGQKSYAVAIVDSRLAECRDIDLALHISRSYGTALIVLAESGELSPADARFIDAPIFYLLKPIDIDLLLLTVHAITAQATMMGALRLQSKQLSQALEQKRDISTAVGMVMERYGIAHDAAFEALRRQARRRQEKIEVYAKSLLTATHRLQCIGRQTGTARYRPPSQS